MATILQVTPGDLITADLFNQILTRLADLEGKVGTGAGATVVVPIVFGRTLAEARATLINPVNQLTLGGVFDTAGNTINATVPGNGGLRVIVQMPSFGERVVPGTAVGLVVAATGASTPTTDPPSITDVLPDPVPIGAAATVEGLRFATPAGANTVTFDGIPAEMLSGNSVSLVVRVPPGIPGVPKPNSSVVVRTATGLTSLPFSSGVAAAQAGQPTIGTISPSTGIVNSTVTINGTGFSGTGSQNVVTFDGRPGTVESAGTTSLTVRVPTNIPGINATTPTREDVPVVVTVNGIPSLPRLHAFGQL